MPATSKAPSAVVGVSHLVIGCEDAESLGKLLLQRGYSRTHHIPDAENLPSKAPFAVQPLAKNLDIALWTSTEPAPPMELVQPKRPFSPPPATNGPMCYYLGEARPDNPQNLDGAKMLAPGLADLGGNKSRPVAMSVRTDEPKEAAFFWASLGAEIVTLKDGVQEVLLPSVMTQTALTIYIFADPKWQGHSWLDGIGATCISLLCRNANVLRDALTDAGHQVGDLIDYTPFDRSLRLFFARAKNGGLFEFISASGR